MVLDSASDCARSWLVPVYLSWRACSSCLLLFIACLFLTSCTKDTGADACANMQINCSGTCIDVRTDRTNCGVCGVACGDDQVCSQGSCQKSCSGTETSCYGGCFELKTDEEHCGACDISCEDGQTCLDGFCGCAVNELNCGGTCVDPQSDVLNCGGCDQNCREDLVCANGSCDVDCGRSLTDCGSACVNTDRDPDHCGECFKSCSDGEVCSDGMCTVRCQQGLLNCNGRCIDPGSNRSFCGASVNCMEPNDGDVCLAGQICVNGICQINCPEGQIECGGECVDPNTNRVYCGARGVCVGPSSGRECPGGEICNGGICVLNCPTNHIECGGTCADPMTSIQYCGATGDCRGTNGGLQCTGGEYCRGGACVTECTAPLVVCSNACVDPFTNRAFCGATGDCMGTNTGTVCASTHSCVAGRCVEGSAGRRYAGSLTPSNGRWNYVNLIGLPSGDAACDMFWPGSQVCSYRQLQLAESLGELAGAADSSGSAVTSWWVDDRSAAAGERCVHVQAETLPWTYPSMHLGVKGRYVDVMNGQLSSLFTGQSCAASHSVPCCNL